jgi:DNA end-binding protein Ku
MTEKWRPEKHHDTYIEDLKKRIEAKVRAGESRALTAPEKGAPRRIAATREADLMSLLEESLTTRKPSKRAARPAKASSRRSSSARKPKRQTAHRRAA